MILLLMCSTRRLYSLKHSNLLLQRCSMSYCHVNFFFFFFFFLFFFFFCIPDQVCRYSGRWLSWRCSHWWCVLHWRKVSMKPQWRQGSNFQGACPLKACPLNPLVSQSFNEKETILEKLERFIDFFSLFASAIQIHLWCKRNWNAGQKVSFLFDDGRK